MHWSAHLSMLFGEIPFSQRPQAAARAGFTAVESWWPPADEREAWAAACLQHGLAVSCLNADGGDLDRGERGYLNVAARHADAVAALADAVALAARVGAPCVNLLVGRRLPGVDEAGQLELVVSGLRRCGEIAGERGVTIVVEPINELDIPGYLVPAPREGVRLLARVGSPHVRLLYDAYHDARGGGVPARDVAEYLPWTAHVQYADCPGRGRPGTGDLDLPELVEALAAGGYDGAIGLEFDPGGPTLAALRGLPELDG
ncbi:MAG: TIM barrel protein [Solirubrobacterales bacterium]|nr:TIM barrel protein [Solirubrobacterales bacterium]